LRRRYVPDFLFGKAPQGKPAQGELLLGSGVEYITLIFFSVHALFKEEPSASRVLLHPRIMAGNHDVKAEPSCLLEEAFEFDVPVTVYAGIRRLPRFVGFDEAAYHLIPKILRKVKHIVGHAQTVGDKFRIIYIGKGAAPFMRYRRPGPAGIRLFSGYVITIEEL
jgi:hypothetical protein